ncbi:uncharacterized protein LOC115228650 [Octopus sinensis]|uniref:Uncharacterized protein LOC115228650 n=1 Tax=Octopus sinensis TaxID=2607531 RepID=A0A6P7TYP1_9MOLL|nr:uncharacterized protein LOC115228650 [Octopus sinensis]
MISCDEFFGFLTKLQNSKRSSDIINFCKLLSIVGPNLASSNAKKLKESVRFLESQYSNPDMTVVFTIMDFIDVYKSNFSSEIRVKDDACIAEINRSRLIYSSGNKSINSKEISRNMKTDADNFQVVGKGNINYDVLIYCYIIG